MICNTFVSDQKVIWYSVNAAIVVLDHLSSVSARLIRNTFASDQKMIWYRENAAFRSCSEWYLSNKLLHHSLGASDLALLTYSGMVIRI